MNLARSIMFILVGAAAGVGLVVACSEDARSEADAAGGCVACDLTNAFSFPQSSTQSIPVGGTGAAEVTCEQSSHILLSGGCLLLKPAPAPGVVTISENGLGPGGKWYCRWHNNSSGTVEALARATCFVPAN